MTTLMLLQATVLTASAIALAAAGVLAPFLTQLTKRYLGADSLKAYALHLAISAGLAAGALYLTGELTTTSLATSFPIVTTVATTVFQLFKKDSGLSTNPVPPEPEEPTVETKG